jgi:hypothetical protein
VSHYNLHLPNWLKFEIGMVNCIGQCEVWWQVEYVWTNGENQVELEWNVGEM